MPYITSLETPTPIAPPSQPSAKGGLDLPPQNGIWDDSEQSAKPTLQAFLEQIMTLPGPNGEGGYVAQDPKNGDGTVLVAQISQTNGQGQTVADCRGRPQPGRVRETVNRLVCYEFHYFDLVCGTSVAPAFFGGYWIGHHWELFPGLPGGEGDCPSSDCYSSNFTPMVISKPPNYPALSPSLCAGVFVGPCRTNCIPECEEPTYTVAEPQIPISILSDDPVDQIPQIADLPQNWGCAKSVTITMDDDKKYSAFLRENSGDFLRFVANNNILIAMVLKRRTTEQMDPDIYDYQIIFRRKVLNNRLVNPVTNEPLEPTLYEENRPVINGAVTMEKTFTQNLIKEVYFKKHNTPTCATCDKGPDEVWYPIGIPSPERITQEFPPLDQTLSDHPRNDPRPPAPAPAPTPQPGLVINASDTKVNTRQLVIVNDDSSQSYIQVSS